MRRRTLQPSAAKVFGLKPAVFHMRVYDLAVHHDSLSVLDPAVFREQNA